MVLSLAGRGILARKSGVKAVLLLGGSGTGVLIAGIVLILVLAIGLGDGAQTSTTTPGDEGCPIGAVCTGEVFDPGTIISDKEFYDSTAMTETSIRDFIQLRGAACTTPNCLRAVRVNMSDQPADAYCAAVTGGVLDAAAVIARVAVACGVNPRVMLVTLQKESGLVTRTDPTPGTYGAAWGWHCPDTGPGGTANCDPAHAGLANQAYGMAKQWSRYRIDPSKYTYHAGQTVQILFNVAESGCGAAPVTITNQATAGLYNYTPYQPNQASLAAYLGTGDQCSSYGNRNFFFLYQSYFGSTGGGTPATTGPARGIPVGGTGTTVDLPAAAEITGTVTTPNQRAAVAIRAALSWLGTPYAWGGGNPQGPTLGIKAGCSQLCQVYQDWTITGFDCSGLTLYAWAQAGVPLSHGSYDQVNQGRQYPYSQAQPGDLLFWGGTAIHHVALYLGTINGQDYVVEAPGSGQAVRVAVVRTGGDFNDIAVRP